MNKTKWISFNIYYDFNINIFLIDALLPYLINLKNNQLIKSFFYIRYSDPFLHIRLRLLVDKNKRSLERKIRNEIKEELVSHIYKKEIKTKYKISDLIIRKKYQQEIRRYGGISGLKISENQFELSSITVLKILKTINNNNKLIISAIKLHYNFSLSTNLSFYENQLMYESISNDWVNHTINKYNIKGERQKIITFYEESTLKNIDKIVSIIQKEETKKEINSYYKQCKELNNKLENIKIEKTKSQSIEINLISIYKDYIHLTNNRLGISNKDEGQIAYVLMKIFNRLNLEN